MMTGHTPYHYPSIAGPVLTRRLVSAFGWLLRSVPAGLLLVTLAGTAALAAPDDGVRTDEVRQEIAGLLARSAALPADSDGDQTVALGHEVTDLYRARDFRPLWQSSSGMRIAAHALVERLRSAAEHGLCSEDYLLLPIERRLSYRGEFVRRGERIPPADAAILDLLLTQSFFLYGTHLVEGRVDPALAHVDWRARRRKIDLAKLLPPAVEGDSLGRLLAELAPPHAGYRDLMTALAGYRELAAHGGWPQVPGGESLRPGDIDPRVPKLRARLRVTGELNEAVDFERNAYGPITVAAVRRFQQRHGLDPDGVVGKLTLAALNVPVEARIRQIELNLERWRWLARDLGKRHIRVNIADYSLQVVENGVVVLAMPVIVGTPYRKTPVFTANMTYLEFAPYWTVPATILREDKLPAIRKNPAYLQEHHFRVIRSSGRELSAEEMAGIDWSRISAERFPGELRMDPGAWNPLGRVKFMFPNAFNVYLHDTNERWLFDQNRRTFSSGCIRIERPVELARYLLLSQPGWSEERLQESLQRSKPMQVGIDPVPTHIQYWTSWVDRDGRLQFRTDLYQRDLDLEVALADPQALSRHSIATPRPGKSLLMTSLH
jgi:murein L,D-transpeptidase YcbB/YkuD